MPEVRVGFTLLFHQVTREEGVFWRQQSVAVILLSHLRPNWTLHSHFEGNDFLLWNVENCFSFHDVSACVHTTVIGGVIPHFQLVKLGSVILHPVEHSVESSLLLNRHVDLVVSIVLFFDFDLKSEQVLVRRICGKPSRYGLCRSLIIVFDLRSLEQSESFPVERLIERLSKFQFVYHLL